MSDEAQDLIETVNRVLHDMGNPNPRESRAWLLGFAQNVMNARAAPKVKKLVWEPQEIARLATPGTYRTAKTQLGHYEIYQFEYQNGRISGWLLRTPATADLIGFDREADAKDAAQADYKRRALSCFEGARE